jgi:hypothetical protein
MDRRGRPSIDPVVMIRMLIVGYVFAIRSERQLCREVQVNLAYRWFCDLELEDPIPITPPFHCAQRALSRERYLPLRLQARRGAPEPDRHKLDELAFERLVASELVAVRDGRAVVTPLGRKVIVRVRPASGTYPPERLAK